MSSYQGSSVTEKLTVLHRAPVGVWVEKAVHRLEPCRVLLYTETSSYVHHVTWVLRTPIAQGDLLQNGIGWQSLQVLQVGVEEGAVAQTGTQKPFHNVAYRAVIREPYPLGRTHEAA